MSHPLCGNWRLRCDTAKNLLVMWCKHCFPIQMNVVTGTKFKDLIFQKSMSMHIRVCQSCKYMKKVCQSINIKYYIYNTVLTYTVVEVKFCKFLSHNILYYYSNL